MKYSNVVINLVGRDYETRYVIVLLVAYILMTFHPGVFLEKSRLIKHK